MRFSWSTAVNGSVLTESERLAVVVTEMFRLVSGADTVTRDAAKGILVSLLADPHLSEEDQRLIKVVLA